MASSVDGAAFLLNRMTKKLNGIRDMLAILGILYTSHLALKVVWKFLAGFRTHVWSRVKQVDYVQHYGKWAVVTGCTDGIGNAFAHLLAKRGMNIVLISRSMDKLQKTSLDLETTYGTKTEIIQADFSGGRSIYANIAAQLQDKDIGVLVNNVGTMYEYPMMFEELPEESLWQHIMINVGAVTMMTHLVLPGMIKRKRGAIINMSSSSAIYPLPMMAIYSATKVYVDYFTRSLQHEYRNSGIDIQCLIPFYVSTALTSFSGTLHRLKWLVPDAPTYAKHALQTLGHAKRTTGHWSHGLQYLIFGSVPEWVWLHSGYWMQKLLRYDADARKRKMLEMKTK